MTEIIKPNKPTSDKEVVKLENQLQVTLPAEYRSFLLKYNGGVPNNLEFTAEKYGDSILREFLGLGVGDIHDIYYGLATFKGRVPTEFLVIGRDLAGNMILLGIKDKYVGKSISGGTKMRVKAKSHG